MKANSRNVALEKSYRQIYTVIEDNLLVVMHVLREKHGFGAKRMERFLFDVQEQAAKLNEMIEDDVADEKTGAERTEYGTLLHSIIRERAKYQLPADIMAVFDQPAPTAQETVREWRKSQKAKRISMAEAADAQSKMLAAKAWALNGGMERAVKK